MTKPQVSNLKSLISNLKLGHWSLIICLILLLCAIAVTPLLHSESLCTHDGSLHYFRVTAMRHALQDGILFTRYLPDLAFGYGYPFFNYRAALSYYLALALHLTGMALPVALNGVYILSILGSALTAYLLARDLFGPHAGIVAAVAYAYAPYQFLDALLRGNAPESVALPLFPLILWAFRRLALTGQRRWFLTSVGSLVALLMTHNISSLLFSPLLLAYLIVLWLVYRREGHWIAVGGALALAFGLTAFFWGPALLERDYVQLHMSHVTRNNDFHYNFLGLAEIFAPPAPVDTSLMNPPMRVHLGLVQAVLAMVGLIVGVIQVRKQRSRGAEEQGSKGAEEQGDRGAEERRATLIFFAASAVFFIFMGTRASLWLWEHVPLLPFVQFPWRFVGRAALPVALLASALFADPPARSSATCKLANLPTCKLAHLPTCQLANLQAYILPLTSCLLLILSALPSTYPPHGYCPSAPHPTISDVFAYEHRSKLVGVDPEGSYFPVWVKHRPDGSPLEEQYSAGGPVTRFDETVLPTGASIVEADYGPNRAHLVVETPVPFRARYLAFYFPGWRVTVDGDPVSIAPTEPEGLISFDVPAGRHTVAIHFRETPLRLVADAISLLSLVAGILVLVYWYTGKLVNSANHQVTNLPIYQPTNLPIYKSTIILAVLMLVFKLAIVDRTDTIFRRPTLRPDTTLPSVKYPLSQPYTDGLTLIGYNQNHTLLSADGTLRLDLYWTAYAQPAARYQTVAHLIGSDGLRWSLPDTFRPRGYADYPPTTTWSPGRYALDSHEIEPLPGTPPGTYDVVLTVFDRATLAPLSVLNEQGQPAAPDLTLGQVILTAPHHPLPPSGGEQRGGLGIRHRFDAPLGPLTLLGADFDRDQAAPGDPILLTTFWHADQQPAQDLTFHLALLAPDGSIAAEYDFGETRFFGKNPVSTGDTWRDQHFLHLPANLDTGDYTWTLSLSPSPCPPVSLSSLSITAPTRTFAPPPVDIEIGTRLGNIATLVGTNVDPAQSTNLPTYQSTNLPIYQSTNLTVTLIWRAEAKTHTSYHAFLHLIGPGGALVAQSDGIPANWTRPTTGWLPGEYVTDARVLTIPPDTPAGDYTLYAGLYIPSGERLTAPDGSDAIHLTTITVQAQ